MMTINHIVYLALLIVGVALWSLIKLIVGGISRLVNGKK